MPTFNIRSNTRSTGSDFLPTDFVSTDAADLACHMSHCAGSHSPFFALHAALQSVHSVVSPRLVTVALIAVSVSVGLGLLAAL